MKQTRPLLAVLDGEPMFCRAPARVLKSGGFDIVTFTRGSEFLSAWALHMPTTDH